MFIWHIATIPHSKRSDVTKLFYYCNQFSCVVVTLTLPTAGAPSERTFDGHEDRGYCYCRRFKLAAPWHLGEVVSKLTQVCKRIIGKGDRKQRKMLGVPQLNGRRNHTFKRYRKNEPNPHCKRLKLSPANQGCGAVTFLVGSGFGSGSGEAFRLRLRFRVKLFGGSSSGSGSGQNVPAPAAPAPAPAPMIKSSYKS